MKHTHTHTLTHSEASSLWELHMIVTPNLSSYKHDKPISKMSSFADTVEQHKLCHHCTCVLVVGVVIHTDMCLLYSMCMPITVGYSRVCRRIRRIVGYHAGRFSGCI